MSSNRLVSGSILTGEKKAAEQTLRPHSWQGFIGQEALKKNLRVFIAAAQKRGEPLDHVLLCGPPGLGKTTLARLIAHHAQAGFRQTSGPVLLRSGDLAALLSSLESGDVLFIDEIHRLSSLVEEVLYPAMEDKQLDILVGSGASARSLRVELNPFTLIGATTRSGLLTRPLRERFGMTLHLQFYDVEELGSIVSNYAQRLGVMIDTDGALEIARRARMTPRVALRLLRRVRDFADTATADTASAGTATAGTATAGTESTENKAIHKDLVRMALQHMGVDDHGLDALDRRYITCLADTYAGGPVGIDALAASLWEQKDVIEDSIEPFLLQKGFLQRKARGRLLSRQGWQYLQKEPPEHLATDNRLPFDRDEKEPLE